MMNIRQIMKINGKSLLPTGLILSNTYRGIIYSPHGHFTPARLKKSNLKGVMKMSAFMMDPKTTAMLAEEVINLLPAKTYITANDKEVIVKACRKWNQSQEVPHINPINSKTLFHVMENMNALSLNARYGDEVSDCISPYPANAKKPANLTALYKSLKCYLYQCCEGSVPKSELYKALENISTTIAQYIISDLPEYELAAWG